MDRQTGSHTKDSTGFTRRDVLTTSVAAGLGAGAVSLAGTTWPGTAAAAETPVPGGKATVINYGYPEVWDPHLAGTLGALGSISPMYNQVVEFNPLNPSEVIGDLAKSWDVADGGMTYTFKLHENVTWWDGKPLTAEDVVFSLNRMMSRASHGHGWGSCGRRSSP